MENPEKKKRSWFESWYDALFTGAPTFWQIVTVGIVALVVGSIMYLLWGN